MKALFNRFVREESGQDLVEYALLLGIITVASIATLNTIGGYTSNLYTAAKNAIGTANGAQ